MRKPIIFLKHSLQLVGLSQRKSNICKHNFGNSRAQQTQTAKNIEETTFNCWFDNASKKLGQNMVVWKLEAMGVGNCKLFTFFYIMTHVFNMSSSGGPSKPKSLIFANLIGGRCYVIYLIPFQQNILSKMFDSSKWWTS